ncbi:hypothetical protein VMUT_0155 [Vulcanisaeta moutnovskia 768-28]|uniref:Uncharacterized protein n=1 Tax=Vulcanisaeta moutnovskia (strain 768-28) TaxID=985053 RepID=F0QSV0_VULM7|nr:hypothetical protein [Vulcanisaeta moutnovskia]ADY00371.1 hypothetical protein VMUT_0155 [Vulcanisaeta moutnovskia 768-28]
MVKKSKVTIIISLTFLIVLTVMLVLPRIPIPSTIERSINQRITTTMGNNLTLTSIDVPIYVVGLATLVQKLINAGINQSLIKPVTINELPSLPSNSLVIIDWSVLGPSLVVNKSGGVFVNTNSTVFGLIVLLIERGDFLIIHGNASDVLLIERALALAWSRAYNTSIIATPIPKYLNGLNYVIAFGNSRVLIIGPHTITSALETASNLWIPIITKQPINPEDPCETLASEYSVPPNTPTQITSTAYAIVYGQQSYSDSFGTTNVDFCLTWSTTIDENVNGAAVSWAELYNYITYAPGSGVEINYLKSFQDAYTSYETYKYYISQGENWIPIINAQPGYWTDSYGQEPGSQPCTTSYSIGITVGIATGGLSMTITCLGDQIILDPSGTAATSTQIGAAINNTWIMEPTSQTAATVKNTLATDSWGAAYMGPANEPAPTYYYIPAGVSALVEEPNSGCPAYPIPVPGNEYEHVIYDIAWEVINNVGPLRSSSGAVVMTPPGYNPNQPGWSSTNNGFYIYQYCTPTW